MALVALDFVTNAEGNSEYTRVTKHVGMVVSTASHTRWSSMMDDYETWTVAGVWNEEKAKVDSIDCISAEVDASEETMKKVAAWRAEEEECRETARFMDRWNVIHVNDDVEVVSGRKVPQGGPYRVTQGPRVGDYGTYIHLDGYSFVSINNVRVVRRMEEAPKEMRCPCCRRMREREAFDTNFYNIGFVHSGTNLHACGRCEIAKRFPGCDIDTDAANLGEQVICGNKSLAGIFLDAAEERCNTVEGHENITRMRVNYGLLKKARKPRKKTAAQ